MAIDVGYMIVAPSGAQLRITQRELRRWASKFRGEFQDQPDLRIIQSLPASRILMLGTLGSSPWTEGDTQIWQRERKHPVPVQSFKFLSGDVVLPTPPGMAKAQGGGIHLTPTEVQDLVTTLKQARGLADPETALLIAPRMLQGRLRRVQGWILAAIRALEAELTAPVTRREEAQEMLRAAAGDGWGHTTENASVEDLLREWQATEKGTDKHEQTLRKLLTALEPLPGCDGISAPQLLAQVKELVRALSGTQQELKGLRHRIEGTETFLLDEVTGKELGDESPNVTIREVVDRLEKLEHAVAHPLRKTLVTIDLDKRLTEVEKLLNIPGVPPAAPSGPMAIDPASRVPFVPCPAPAFDKQVGETLLDSASAPDGPADTVRFEESCPEPDVPTDQVRRDEGFL